MVRREIYIVHIYCTTKSNKGKIKKYSLLNVLRDAYSPSKKLFSVLQKLPLLSIFLNFHPFIRVCHIFLYVHFIELY